MFYQSLASDLAGANEASVGNERRRINGWGSWDSDRSGSFFDFHLVLVDLGFSTAAIVTTVTAAAIVVAAAGVAAATSVAGKQSFQQPAEAMSLPTAA